jgi:putative DNA primase/helicase
MRFCGERMPSRGSDWVQMVQKCAKSVCRYPAGYAGPTVLIAGRLPGQGAAPSSTVPEVFEWSEVEPLDDQLRPVAQFKPEFLPDAIRPWVTDVSERMSVPLDFTGICALTTIAGVIGRRVFVCPKAKDKEWRESVALSGAVVAESGKTKTPTWKTFTNIVVEKEADWQEDHKKKAAKYAEDSKAWEALDKKNKEAERKTGVVQNTPPAPEEPTPSRRLLLNDATPEKMHDVMKSNPCGLFYLRDELSSWVAEFDKEGREVQRGMFLAAMNGNDPYTVDRIGRDGGAAIMCVSVFGGFQPDMFRDFLNNATNVSDGTIPRFPFLVWPDESDLPIIDRTANDSAKQQFRRVIRELAEMNEKQILIHFSPEAQSVFDSWLVSLNQKIHTEENSGKRSHLSKYKGALPKIAALLQIVDLVSNGPLAGTHVIDQAHINKAIDLLAYLETHMHRIYGCIQTPIQKAESAIAKRLRNGDLNSCFTIRAIQRKHWRDLSRPEYIDLALETLVEKGWLRDLPKAEGRGRPTTAWEINPALERRTNGGNDQK